MLGYILSKALSLGLPRKKWYDDLPEGCTYDKDNKVVVVIHRGVRGYFNEKLIKEMDKAGIDYIDDFKKAVDEVFDVEDP